MAISANVLFHVTPSLENLKNILSEGFRVHYCKETFSSDWIIAQNAEQDSQNAEGNYVPMVSFSDIPLSEIKAHFDKYKSKYAIGLSKEWAISTGLNPVLYTHHQSQLTKELINFLREDFKTFHSQFDVQNTNKLYRMFRYILSHTKNYEGIIKNDRIEENNLAYNEREWRYVPGDRDLAKIGIKKDMLDILDRCGDKLMTELIQDIKLTFSPTDIRYLIIENKNEIKALSEFITGKFPNEKNILLTRIFTLEQIINDF